MVVIVRSVTAANWLDAFVNNDTCQG